MNNPETNPDSSIETEGALGAFKISSSRSVEPWILGVTVFLMTLMVHFTK